MLKISEIFEQIAEGTFYVVSTVAVLLTFIKHDKKK